MSRLWRAWGVVLCASTMPVVAQSPIASSDPPQATLSVFRIFLHDGRVLHSHGECATLPKELVCMVKLGGGAVAESYDVLTVARSLVDEDRTSGYARALRAAQYGATRGEREYAELTADLARALSELESSTDRDRRLGIAQVARYRLTNWSKEHFGYKADEARQLVTMLDEVIAELRIAAGETTFSLDMVANVAPVGAVPLMAAPDVSQSIETAIDAAAVTGVAAERLSLLRSAHRAAHATPGVDVTLRARVAAALDDEEAVDRRYRALMADAITRADVAVRHGRASVLQRLLREVAARDRALGTRRPREMAAFGRRLDIELALATEQQAAFARWAQVKDQLLAYELKLRPILDGWVSQRPVLRNLEDGIVPSPSAVDRALRRFAVLDRSLNALRPVAELREVHALLQSALQMARQGLLLGQRLTVAANSAIGRNASAAVAGAELLLAQARTDLVPALNPRRVR